MNKVYKVKSDKTENYTVSLNAVNAFRLENMDSFVTMERGAFLNENELKEIHHALFFNEMRMSLVHKIEKMLL